MSEESESEAVPKWLQELESKRERRLKARLGHEAGAGAPCLTCENNCPGLDLHFWRKICKNCKCSKEAHNVQDEDLYGWAQFQLLGSKPANKTKFKLPGKQDEVVLDWVPKGNTETVQKYLKSLPSDKLPVSGSEAAQKRKKLLEKQIPLHDIDPSLCHELTQSELEEMNKYIAHVKEKSVGVGKLVNLGIRKGMVHNLHPNNSTIGHSEAVLLQNKNETSGLSKPLAKLSLGSSLLLNNINPKEEALNLSQSKIRDINYSSYSNSGQQNLLKPEKAQEINKTSNEMKQHPSPYSKEHLAIPEQYSTSEQRKGTKPEMGSNLAYSLPNYLKEYLQQHPYLIKQGILNEEYLKQHPELISSLIHEALNRDRNPFPEYSKEYFAHHPETLSKLVNQNPNYCIDYLNQSLMKPEWSSVLPQSYPNKHLLLHPDAMHQGTLNEEYLKQHPELISSLIDEALNRNLNPFPEYSKEYLQQHPEALSSLIQNNPNYCIDFLKQNPELSSSQILSNSAEKTQPLTNYSKEFLKEHPEVLLQIFRNNPASTEDYLKQHPELIKVLDKAITDQFCPEILDPLGKLGIQKMLPNYAENKYPLYNDNQNPAKINNLKDFAFKDYKNIGNKLQTSPNNNQSLTSLPKFQAGQIGPSESLLNPTEVPIGAIRDIEYPEIRTAALENNDFYFDYNPKQLDQLSDELNLPNCHRCKRKFEVAEFAISIDHAEFLFHPDCFTCIGCNQNLADNVYFFHKKSNDVYCGRDYAKIRGFPRCNGCDELIFNKEYCLVTDASYHLKHFCCFQCDKPLAGENYLMEENLPYCLPCYELTKANKCATCKKIIRPDEVGCTMKDLHFHVSENCIACKICHKVLIEQKLLVRNGALFCSHDCFNLDKI